MIEEAESAEDSDELDDGWDEIGIGKSEKMGADELGRAKKVHGILRFVQLFHRRILRDVLATSQENAADNSTLDTLSSFLHTLPSASDELVATLYTPQDASNIATELKSFRKVISDLEASLVGSIFLGKQNWLNTWFVQVYKAIDCSI